jgi:hypothetical protein
MLTQDEFVKCMGRLQEATEKLSPAKTAIYFDRLKHTDFNVLWKAITIMLDNYKYKRFPSIAEIKDAIKDADRMIAWAIAKEAKAFDPGRFKDERCPICSDTGWEVITYFEPLYNADHEKAVNCSCPIGVARRNAWAKDAGRDIPATNESAYAYLEEG